MSMESGGWRYSGPRAQRARPEAVAYHDGDRHDFVRRYHKVIAKAVQRRRQGVRELAPYVLKWATDPRNFRAAWEHCRGGGGSPGPNGRRYEDYEEHDIWALAKVMQAAVLAGTYRPGPERRVRIHKSGKRGYRWLTLQDIEDRVMARAFQQVLGPLLDPFFDNYVFGSRPGRSREQALATAEYLTLQQGRHVWLGYALRLGKGQLETRIAKKAWKKLEEHLARAHAQPDTPLMANMAIRGWISQMGPCYTYEDPHQTIARVKSMAQRWALDEIPSSHDLQGRWQRAHARWCRLRKGIMERGGATSGGFARHVVFSVLPRRGDGASSGAPSPSFSPSEEIVLYTDGCCLKPSHVGGWAYILHAHSRLQWLTGCGGLRRTTSNRVELIAAIKGFRRLAPGTSVVLISDSTYVVQGINENLDLWRARGWRAGSGRHRRPLRNADLWQRLDELLGRLQVTCRHVPGHAGHRENELCDQLAREEAILLACGLSAQHRTKITT